MRTMASRTYEPEALPCTTSVVASVKKKKAVATLAFVAGYAAARSQSFRKLGLFHQHVSSATVGVQLDMGPFQDYVFSLSKALSDVKFQRMNSFVRGTCSWLITTMHGIESRLGDYVLFFDAHPGVFISGWCRWHRHWCVGVESLKTTVGEMESRQNILVRQMSGLTNDTLALEKNFLKLKGALEMIRSFELRVSHLFKIKGAIQQVTVLADKYFAGQSSLMDRKVSMDLVSSKVTKREIEDLKTTAFSSGFELVFQDFAQIYQFPASYMATEGVINVVVDIPLVPITDYGKFALYKHDSFPCCLCDIFTGKTSGVMRVCD